MANLKFKTNGSITIKLKTVGTPFTNSFQCKQGIITRRPDDSGNDFVTFQLNTAYTFQDSSYLELSGATSQLSKDGSNYYQFEVTGEGTVEVEGDLISLINNDAYVKQYQFFNLFKGCSKITSIANLNFPASIADWCYANMFMDCTGLVNAGTTLPATATSRWCYQGMFARCTALTTPPNILATKLAPFCYMGMFTGCTSLVTAPSLFNRTVEGDFSTNIMFKDCSNLSTIQVSFTNWPSGGTWSRKWLNGVSNTGLFIHPNTLPVSAIEATSAVPAGWTLSATYASTIAVVDQTYSFDAMSDTNQTKVFGFSYDGEETLNIAVDTTNKPSWLSYTTDNNSVDFVADGYAIDSSTSFQIPITFSAADAESKSVVATFNISNYPTYTITLNTIPTFSFDATSETNIVSSLLDYATNATSCQIVGELPTGLSANNGIITGTPTEFTSNFKRDFNIIYSASDARSVASSVNVQIVNAEPDYSTLPLTFKSYGNTSFYLIKNGSPYSNTFYINKNNTGWQLYTSDATGSTISLTDGETVAFSGTNGNLNMSGDNNRWCFRSNDSMTTSNYLEVYGNIQSLTNYQPLVNYVYRGLFYDSFGILSSAWNLVLPSANLPQEAFACLFRGSSTKIAPKMMHIGDPMPYALFDATFYNNSGVKYIGIDCSEFNYTVNKGNWVNGVSSNGVFVRTYPRTPFQVNAGAIPYNWTVIDLCEDGKYYLDNGMGTPTTTEVIVNPDGTYTTV